MSLAKTKLKENLGKKANISKLKTVLTSPYRNKCPVLEESEEQKLRELLQEKIISCNKSTQAFTTERNLHIGLQSTLRAINNGKASFVLLSLSIKPHYLISLIARNAETKDETVPVYVQPKLEVFTNEIFGIRAIALAFPKDAIHVNDELGNWIKSKQKPKKAKSVAQESKAKVKLISKEKTKTVKRKKATPAKQQINEKLVQKNEKDFSGDFISFSSTSHYLKLDSLKLDEEKQLLDGVLSKLQLKTMELNKIESTKLPQDIDSTNIEELPSENTAESAQLQMSLADSDNDDDFMEDYQPLVLHKIKQNPNKKPKKKKQIKKVKQNK